MADRLITCKLAQLAPDTENLRYELTDIDELAQSIAFIGLLEPIRVQKDGDKWRIVAGHRRHAALMQLAADKNADAYTLDTEIKCVTSGKIHDQERDAAFLIENLQRVDLAPKATAEGVRRLMQQHGMLRKEVAAALGVSTDWVKQREAMLNAPDVAFNSNLSVEHLAMLGELDDTRQARLVKKYEGSDHWYYGDVEDAHNKQKSHEHADRLTKKWLKDGYLVVTDKQLKKLIGLDDLHGLSGVDLLVASQFVGAKNLHKDLYREPTEPCVTIRKKYGPGELVDRDGVTKNSVIVRIAESGGAAFALAELVVPKRQSVDQDGEVEVDPYDAECDRIDEENAAKREAHQAAEAEAARKYLTTMKASQLTVDLMWLYIHRLLTGFNSTGRRERVAELLNIKLPDKPVEENFANPAEYRNEVKGWEDDTLDVLIGYANKNGSNLVRLTATASFCFYTQEFVQHATIDMPEPPEYENYPDWDDDDEGDAA